MNCTECNSKATHVCSDCYNVAFCSEECHGLFVGDKRKWNANDQRGDAQRDRRDEPADYNLPAQLQNRLGNVNFLQTYIEDHGLDYIYENVLYSYNGFTGALNATNLFWFLVYKYKITTQAFVPHVNYRSLIVNE